MTESLKAKTIKNVSYNAIGKVIAFGSQGLANIILSQNLGASDYGIVGFAMIFVNFLARFNDLGIQSAVIRQKELDDKTLYTAFTTKAFLGVLMYLVTFVIAGIAPYFFDNPVVSTVIRLISLNFIINTFAFLPRVMLNRELNFKKISASEVSMIIISSIIASTMALQGYKYWSIVTATIVSNLLAVLLITCLKPVKIKFAFDKVIAKELIRYGGNIFLSGIVMFLLFNADNLIVGSVAGSASLGYYALAFNWGALICTVLSEVVHSVLFPTFSRMQGDTDRIKNAYLQVLECVGFVAVLVNLTLFLGAEQFLYYVLGKGSDKWLPALTTFRIMCCYGIVRAMLEPVGSVIMAIGKTELLLKANLLASAIELILLYQTVKLFGIEGVGILIILAYASQYVIYWPIVKKNINISADEILNCVKAYLYIFVIVIVTYKIFYSSIPKYYSVCLIPLFVITFIVLSGIVSNWRIIKIAKSLIFQRH